ncbi:MAG: NACHT domain-containing protein [Sulfuricella sp.]
MMLVSRRVRKVPDQENTPVENPPEHIQKFRTQAAWVLLGEPGAGKSAAFEMEAEATNGQYLRIDEFINADPQADWQGKTLFLDGLDETRASGSNDSTLQQLCRQLKRLGNPSFRVACRAADWYGLTDRSDLKRASPDGQLAVLLLEPLNSEDTFAILRENHGITDPQKFVEEAEKRGVAGLLDNPQTLGLLAQAIRGDQWPGTRDDTYRLACEKLAEEASKRHRNKNRNQPRDLEKVLAAAGQLSAILLFSNKTGIALDPERANERFPALADCAPPDPDAASQAVGSKLFRPAGEECVEPSHRSIAEYLAARWLARQIDSKGLPLQRVLNLLLGPDGGVVAGLRGLFGWLALHCHAARPRLIEADPLTVVVYGDVQPMPLAEKRLILTGLRREAERFSAFHWDAQSAHPFGALADPGLREDFLAILQAPERDAASQSLADCVLDILAHGAAQPELAPILPSLVRDDARWPRVRRSALDVWLKLTTDPQAALALLDDMNEGRVADHDDELAGALLRHLYPAHLAPEVLLHHLHAPKNPSLIGSYFWFWAHELPRCAPDEHLPALLDWLVDHPALHARSTEARSLHEMADGLLARGITVYADQIAGQRLFNWLGIGADEYGDTQREQAAQQTLAAWFGAHPDRYKKILALCFTQCAPHENPAYCVHTQESRLHNATPPDDIGLWHLEQVSLAANDELARMHLSEAVNALVQQRGAAGLSLEQLEAWGDAHPERKHWLEPLLAWEIPEWRTKRVANKKMREQRHSDAKRNRSIALTQHLPAIQAGSVRVDLMHQLAGVWMNRFTDTPGKTPAERFSNYCENSNEVLAAAETGFRLCPERADLPTIEEIVELNIKQKEHFIRSPCLVGMELLWRDGAGEIERLSDETLRRMIAFRLTYGADNTPDWFVHLVRQRPELVAEVLIAYASVTLKSGKDYIDSIYPLARDPEYRAVAILAAPRLLETFPVKARSGQLNHLESLLKAALRYTPEELPKLIEKKLAMKGMDTAQRVYWLATATLLDPRSHDATLWRYVGKSETRANYLSGFLSNRFDELPDDYELSAHTLGKLIELIAPHAETERSSGGGLVSDSMRRGDHIRTLITRLGTMPTPEAEQEINRLIGLPALRKLKFLLESARHQQKQRQRESGFRFLPPRNVAQVLACGAPTSAADLTALALHHLDDIAIALRNDNDDGFRSFWNIKDKQPTGQREENLCRDVLLTRMRARLAPLDVDCQPEKDHANDKRADISLSYRTEFELPIEIKRDSNRTLWSALRTQLIEQYANAPRADGHGIYLVLWFGGEGIPLATDGGKKPRSPEELRIRLEAQLDPAERQRIFVRVLDVSWPK